MIFTDLSDTICDMICRIKDLIRQRKETCSMAQEQYPRILDAHRKTDVFHLDDARFFLRSHLAYFHDDEFPLYMHSHDFYELNIIVSGYGRHYIEDKNFPAVPGDVFVIPPNITHGYWAKNNEMNIFHLLITNEMLLKYNGETQSFPGFYLLFVTEPQIRKNITSSTFFLKLNENKLQDILPEMKRLADIAQSSFKGHEIMFEMYSMGLIFELAHLIDNEFQSGNGASQSGKGHSKQNSLHLIINTTNYMRENLNSDFSIDDLARMSMLSRRGYIDHFKEIFGMPPFEYLKELRINKAIDLLRETNYPVSFIAQSCGFSDSSHLIRVFKEMTGTTPTKFRKSENK